MSDPTYPEKKIKTRSIPNVEDERLIERLEYIRANWCEIARQDSGRNDFSASVREIINIERELCHRKIPFKPMTNAAHLHVPVEIVREIRPLEKGRFHHLKKKGGEKK